MEIHLLSSNVLFSSSGCNQFSCWTNIHSYGGSCVKSGNDSLTFWSKFVSFSKFPFVNKLNWNALPFSDQPVLWQIVFVQSWHHTLTADSQSPSPCYLSQIFLIIIEILRKYKYIWSVLHKRFINYYQNVSLWFQWRFRAWMHVDLSVRHSWQCIYQFGSTNNI